MSRILAIDYGKKKTGLAVTDPMQIIANTIDTIPSLDVLKFIEAYIKNEPVETIVVGMPKQMNNQPSESVKYIIPFLNSLNKRFPDIKIETYDERFTSKIAFQAMIDGGMKKKDRRNKENVDKISANLILQSYLESRNNKLNFKL
ncbi:Holliday junction resolvase RuvX [Bacteroidales bacterium]|nr:Holliday junction resolvase RuvX [Bacteroidales bacterium]